MFEREEDIWKVRFNDGDLVRGNTIRTSVEVFVNR